jgi:hypothetical protein
MLRAVHRARLRNRRGAVAEPGRARLADRVVTLVELRRQRCPDPRHLCLRSGRPTPLELDTSSEITTRVTGPLSAADCSAAREFWLLAVRALCTVDRCSG